MHSKESSTENINVLDSVNSVSDIKKLKLEQLKLLADNMREEILRVIDKNGGHLSSNLGIVELTVALYHNFDFPTDKLIFDVGHQCYAHKILSGRKDSFSSIRLCGGLSGFPDRNESEFDLFTTGHAGTSLSSAIGVATARDTLEQDYTVISVVGDGAISNGLNLEALTASKVKPKNLIVILNDNGMSISLNKNGFYQFISKGTTKGGYVKSKRAFKKIFGNSFITRGLVRFRDFIKRVLSKNNYFEQYGFKYVGVVDGNDVKSLDKILKRVKNTCKDKAIFLHVKTTKGKGYKKAEEQADVYHGVGSNLSVEHGSFSHALGQKINSLIEKDKKIVAITAGMKDGTGLKAVEEINPKNFYDVGIAEEYAVTFAAGLAAGGLKPIVALYSTFAQRAYDQIVHDVCLQKLPVIICLDRAGFVGKDGKTHQGVFDLSYLSHIPDLDIYAPCTISDLGEIIDLALSTNNPTVIRYSKNGLVERTKKSINQGLWYVDRESENATVTLIAVGPSMLGVARKVSDENNNVRVVVARSVKPLDTDMLEKIRSPLVITMEENSVKGGFGSLVKEHYSGSDGVKTVAIGVKDQFISHGSIEDQMRENGLTVSCIRDIIEKEFNGETKEEL